MRAAWGVALRATPRGTFWGACSGSFGETFSATVPAAVRAILRATFERASRTTSKTTSRATSRVPFRAVFRPPCNQRSGPPNGEMGATAGKLKEGGHGWESLKAGEHRTMKVEMNLNAKRRTSIELFASYNLFLSKTPDVRRCPICIHATARCRFPELSKAKGPLLVSTVLLGTAPCFAVTGRLGLTESGHGWELIKAGELRSTKLKMNLNVKM